VLTLHTARSGLTTRNVRYKPTPAPTWSSDRASTHIPG